MRILQAAALTSVLAVMILAPGGCGKKGPPVVPKKQPLPVVNNLGVVREAQALILRWTLPPETASATAGVAGFAVYRAKIPIDADCMECPRPYKLMGRVDRQRGRISPEAWHYRDGVLPGYVYRYQVRCYNEAGVQGKASHPVEYSMTKGKDDRNTRE